LADDKLAASAGSAADVETTVRRGAASVAVIIPKGFGSAARAALAAGRDKPELRIVYDPSRNADLAIVRGIATEYAMQALIGSPGLGLPSRVRGGRGVAGARRGYNGYAHSFAGMGVQFLMLAAVDLAVAILLERQRGLWKRVRSAPVSRLLLLGGKAASA